MADTSATRRTQAERLARIEEILARIDKQMTDNGHPGIPSRLHDVEHAVQVLNKSIVETNARITLLLNEEKADKEKGEKKAETRGSRLWQLVYQVYQVAIGLVATFLAIKLGLGG